MRIAAMVVVVALGGCDGLFGLRHLFYTPDEPRPDATVTVVIDAPTTCAPGETRVGGNGPGGAGLLALCVPSTVPSNLSIAGSMITPAICDATMIIDSAGTAICIKWAANVSIGSITVTGEMPLVIVATESMLVAGAVDVSSQRGKVFGAGANWSQCRPQDGPAGKGGSGGAGGSFGTPGGNSGVTTAGLHALADSTAPADRVRGGCPGGAGGSSSSIDGSADTSGGNGGGGGGAIYLIAGNALTLTPGASINASGAGGTGGGGLNKPEPGGGGGAGGSGGLIGLDAPIIMISPEAILIANGGGGGAAGALGTGLDGADPEVDSYALPAPGGLADPANASTVAGAGGAGSVFLQSGAHGDSADATGGGGGGAGYIRFFTPNPLSHAMASPPPS